MRFFRAFRGVISNLVGGDFFGGGLQKRSHCGQETCGVTNKAPSYSRTAILDGQRSIDPTQSE